MLKCVQSWAQSPAPQGRENPEQESFQASSVASLWVRFQTGTHWTETRGLLFSLVTWPGCRGCWETQCLAGRLWEEAVGFAGQSVTLPESFPEQQWVRLQSRGRAEPLMGSHCPPLPPRGAWPGVPGDRPDRSSPRCCTICVNSVPAMYIAPGDARETMLGAEAGVLHPPGVLHWSSTCSPAQQRDPLGLGLLFLPGPLRVVFWVVSQAGGQWYMCHGSADTA